MSRKGGSTFGGPASAVVKQEVDVDIEDDEEIDMEDIKDALGNPLHDLPPVVRRRVDALTNLQKQYLDIQKKYHAEVRDLERKYQKLYDPVFDKRANIVAGVHEPTDEEARVELTEEEKAEEEGVKKREADPSDAEIKGIPQFWLQVLQNNSLVSSTIFENDEDALSYLRDIRYAELDGEEGFVITFQFGDNPYFSNNVLTKTYHMEQDEIFGELQFDHATGSKIEWKAGKNITVKQIKKKTKAKGKKPARVVTVEEPCESFFSFFSPVKLPEESDEVDPDEEQELHQEMEMDFELACIMKDKLIPFSLLWFTGEAAEYEDDDMYGDDEDDEDEDGEGGEDDEDEDEEDEDDRSPPKRGRGGRGGNAGHAFAPPSGAKPAAPGQPQQPECKQQ